MSYDYYVYKLLHVVYENDEYEYIPIKKQCRYFAIDEDSDESEKYQKSQLTVKYKPYILFQNNQWKTNMLKVKYEKFINKDKNLISVTKIEDRQKRSLSILNGY